MLLAEFDINIAKEVWQQEAFEEGYAEGYAIGRMEIARNLYVLGVPVETIQRAMGLSGDKIVTL